MLVGEHTTTRPTLAEGGVRYPLAAECGEPDELWPDVLLDGADAKGLVQPEGKEWVSRHVPPPPGRHRRKIENKVVAY